MHLLIVFLEMYFYMCDIMLFYISCLVDLILIRYVLWWIMKDFLPLQ